MYEVEFEIELITLARDNQREQEIEAFFSVLS